MLGGMPLKKAKVILDNVRRQIKLTAGDDQELLFKIRRYIYIRLTYDERGVPAVRKKLKVKKFDEQKGLCAMCDKHLDQISYSHLDRLKAVLGYTAENTRLVHAKCQHDQQMEKGYK